jgi:hypothetical protein
VSAKVKLGLGVVAGGLLGFAYYYFVGCRTGTCAITSNPTNSILYGAVMGLLVAWPSKAEKAKSEDTVEAGEKEQA